MCNALQVKYEPIKKRSKPLGLSSGKLHSKSRLPVKSFHSNQHVGVKDNLCRTLQRPVGWKVFATSVICSYTLYSDMRVEYELLTLPWCEVRLKKAWVSYSKPKGPLCSQKEGISSACTLNSEPNATLVQKLHLDLCNAKRKEKMSSFSLTV